MTERPGWRDLLRLVRDGRWQASLLLVPFALLSAPLGCRAPVTYHEAPARPVAVTASAEPSVASAATDEGSAAPATASAAPSPGADAAVAASAASTAASAADPYAPSGAAALPEPFEQNEQWGYRSGDGRVAIAPRFIVAQPFLPKGIAAVIDEQGWAYVDRRGQVLLRPFLFDNGPDEFREGLARFVHDGKIGYFDESGTVVIDPSFDFGLPFERGRARVCGGCRKEADGEHWRMVGGRWWWIDRQGKEQGPAQPPDARR